MWHVRTRGWSHRPPLGLDAPAPGQRVHREVGAPVSLKCRLAASDVRLRLTWLTLRCVRTDGSFILYSRHTRSWFTSCPSHEAMDPIGLTDSVYQSVVARRLVNWEERDVLRLFSPWCAGSRPAAQPPSRPATRVLVGLLLTPLFRANKMTWPLTASLLITSANRSAPRPRPGRVLRTLRRTSRISLTASVARLYHYLEAA